MHENLQATDVSEMLNDNELKKEVVYPTIKIVHNFNQTDWSVLISGTYCHPFLIPHIACWVSPDFALKVSEIVNRYYIQELQR